MPDLTPAEAMERLRAVPACERCRGNSDHPQDTAAVERADWCPDCALLLIKAIEGPAVEKVARATMEMAKTTPRHVSDDDVIARVVAALSGGPDA